MRHRNRHRGGGDCHHDHHDEGGDHHAGHGRGHGRHGRGRHGGRLFDYGELRLLVLALIENQPSHGYELIKLIEERFGGAYSPSPGVIYPTLAWLDDMGYAEVDADGGNRKCYRITAEGKAFLEANRAAADALLQRSGTARGHAPAPVVRAMENLKMALRLRLREGPVDGEAADKIAAAIDAAAQVVEKSQ